MAYLTQLAMWTLLREIHQEIKKMSGALDTLTAQVQASDTVMGSAVTLIQGFAARLAAAGTDPAALTALANSLNTETQALAAAVASSTAPASAPQPAPAPEPAPAPAPAAPTA